MEQCNDNYGSEPGSTSSGSSSTYVYSPATRSAIASRARPMSAHPSRSRIKAIEAAAPDTPATSIPAATAPTAATAPPTDSSYSMCERSSAGSCQLEMSVTGVIDLDHSAASFEATESGIQHEPARSLQPNGLDSTVSEALPVWWSGAGSQSHDKGQPVSAVWVPDDSTMTSDVEASVSSTPASCQVAVDLQSEADVGEQLRPNDATASRDSATAVMPQTEQDTQQEAPVSPGQSQSQHSQTAGGLLLASAGENMPVRLGSRLGNTGYYAALDTGSTQTPGSSSNHNDGLQRPGLPGGQHVTSSVRPTTAKRRGRSSPGLQSQPHQQQTQQHQRQPAADVGVQSPQSHAASSGGHRHHEDKTHVCLTVGITSPVSSPSSQAACSSAIALVSPTTSVTHKPPEQHAGLQMKPLSRSSSAPASSVAAHLPLQHVQRNQPYHAHHPHHQQRDHHMHASHNSIADPLKHSMPQMHDFRLEPIHGTQSTPVNPWNHTEQGGGTNNMMLTGNVRPQSSQGVRGGINTGFSRAIGMSVEGEWGPDSGGIMQGVIAEDDEGGEDFDEQCEGLIDSHHKSLSDHSNQEEGSNHDADYDDSRRQGHQLRHAALVGVAWLPITHCIETAVVLSYLLSYADAFMSKYE